MNVRFKPLLAFVALAAASCASTTTVPEQHSVASPAPAQPAPVVAPSHLPARSCKELQRDAYVLIGEHSRCTADADCALADAACPTGFACGAAVNRNEVAAANAELGPLSERFETQCGTCARERVRCGRPSLVCSEGRCAHQPAEGERDRLEREAEALIEQNDACAADSDCVFARDSGACPSAFACGATVNKASEQAFAAQSAPLSKTFHEYCHRCMVDVTHCSASTPICEGGRCSRRRSAAGVKTSPEEMCKQLEDSAGKLVLEHNRCQVSEDCVIAADVTCPVALSCGVALNKAEERDFRERIAGLSNSAREQCGCDDAPGDCAALAPMCTDGRCRLEPVAHRHPPRLP